MKKLLMIVAGVALVVAIGAGLYVAIECPCDRIPGVTLDGDPTTEPVQDWTFANDARLCQLQVTGGLLPQSLNLNCMAGDGDLFISCSRCDGKRWSSTALQQPEGNIKIGTRIYPVRLERLTDGGMLDRAWAARRAKLKSLGRDAAAERPDHWWSFQLTSR